VRLARAFPVVLLALLPMAAWALFLRIDQYGLTPFRVVRAASLLCLAVLGVIGAARFLRGRAPLGWEVPGLVGALALLTAAGPTGAVQLSIASQSRRLARLVDEVGVAERLVPSAAPAATRPLAAERVWALREALTSLSDLGGEAALRRVLAGDVAACVDHWRGAEECIARFGLTAAPTSPWHVASLPQGVALDAGDQRVSFVSLTRGENGALTLEGDAVVAGGARGSLAAHLAAAAHDAALPTGAVPLLRPDGRLAGHLIVQQLTATTAAGEPARIERLEGVWLERRQP
jgi:hypothetical protein